MLQCSRTCFWVQKRGNTPEEYEDAFAFKPAQNQVQGQNFCVAISDGASESSFAAEWALLLTSSYRRRPFTDRQDIQTRVAALSKRWHRSVFGRPLLWFAEEKARMGAFATFLGLELSSEIIEPASSGYWHAVAIGDSCLFQIRDNALIQAFPMQESKHFGNSPDLLSSNTARNRRIWDRVLFLDGEWQARDVFILVTDALAAWFLKTYEQNGRPWEDLAPFLADEKPSGDFVEWVENKRLSTMRNDDVTLAMINIFGE